MLLCSCLDERGEGLGLDPAVLSVQLKVRKANERDFGGPSWVVGADIEAVPAAIGAGVPRGAGKGSACCHVRAGPGCRVDECAAVAQRNYSALSTCKVRI